jgi:hypothetical protein
MCEVIFVMKTSQLDGPKISNLGPEPMRLLRRTKYFGVYELTSLKGDAMGVDLPPPPPTKVPEGEELQDDIASMVVPYRNVQALLAYYLGLFSLFPVLGAILGIAAFVLGIRGLKYANQHSNAHGRVHAWIGVVMGGICGAIWVVVDVLIVIAVIAESAGD